MRRVAAAVHAIIAAMNVPEFQAKWRAAVLTERASAQPHFEDICRLVSHPTPTVWRWRR